MDGYLGRPTVCNIVNKNLGYHKLCTRVPKKLNHQHKEETISSEPHTVPFRPCIWRLLSLLALRKTVCRTMFWNQCGTQKRSCRLVPLSGCELPWRGVKEYNATLREMRRSERKLCEEVRLLLIFSFSKGAYLFWMLVVIMKSSFSNNSKIPNVVSLIP